MKGLAVELGRRNDPVVGSPPLTPEEGERLRKLALTGISVAAMGR